MLEYVIDQTSLFLKDMPKAERKKKGQFFSSKETAVFMAKMFDLEQIPARVEILDPGAGTGILSAALADRIFAEKRCTEIQLTCYENDIGVIPVLLNNLQYIQKNAPIKFGFTIIIGDYILLQGKEFERQEVGKSDPRKYDLIIGNPPYLRLARSHPAAMAMSSIVHGAPNYYFLFAAMSLFNLKENAEMVYIVPRSWTSGEYFRAFRNYFLQKGKLEQIHLFVSRDKVFTQEHVLQETIIIKAKKTADIPKAVSITSSHASKDFHSMTQISVPYDAIVSGEKKYVYLPTNAAEIATIQRINQYSQTFPEIGLRMRTGIVVDFRQKEELRTGPGEHILPLFYEQHIKNGRVHHAPSGKKLDWIADEKPGLIQKNKNYVFCKRFTAKEERRRLQCGIYLASDFPGYEYIGTQNKINFVDRTDGEPLSEQLVYGIYALLNTTLFDEYYRILNGNTQVNSTEINNIPVPPLAVLEAIGSRLMQAGSLSTEVCNEIVKEEAYRG